MTITNKLIEAIGANYITLDELAFIYSLYFKQGWDINLMPVSINKLRRFGVITEDGELSPSGELLLFNCLSDQPSVVIESVDSKFEELWALFPRDDGYKNFPKTRMIRWNKKETRAQYEDALTQCSHEVIMNALRNEIAFRQESSAENMFKYMKGSANWLRDRVYLNFVDYEQEEENQYGKGIS